MLCLSSTDDHVAEFGVGEQITVEEEGGADSRAEGEKDDGAEPRGRVSEPGLCQSRGVRVIEHGDVTAGEMATEEFGDIGSDPALVDVGGRACDLALYYRRKGDADGAIPLEMAHDLDHLGGHSLGGGNFRSGDLVAGRVKFAGGQIDDGTFDTGASDVDAQCLGELTCSHACRVYKRSPGLAGTVAGIVVAMTYTDSLSGDVSLTGLRKLCTELALETAELVAHKRRQLTEKGDIREFSMNKSSEVDPVTVVDTLAEEHLFERISALRPRDGVIGEEGSDKPSRNGMSWVIDPIDGTVNFLYGIPHYAVSVAVTMHGEVLAGAVVNVVTSEVYSAAKGAGARKTLHGEETELCVNSEDSLARALVATGFGYGAQRRRWQGEIVAGLLPRVRDIRRLGSAALDLCHVAEGRVDCYYENGIHAWDFAAGSLIAREAGAAVTVPALSVSGSEGRLSVAAAPGIAGEFQKLLDELGATGGRGA